MNQQLSHCQPCCQTIADPPTIPETAGKTTGVPSTPVASGGALLARFIGTALTILLPAVSPTAAELPTAAPDSVPVPLPALRASWTFDEIHGGVAADASGNGNNAILIGSDAAWTPKAKVGRGALSLSGTNYAEVATAVVDTTQSFTVAAWVNLATLQDNEPCQTAVSIDGDETSSFFLQFNHSAGNVFAFNRPSVMVKSTFSPTTNTWYHLAGVYDASAGTITLYVNGALQESVPYDNPLPGTGKTAIGRGLFENAKVDFFFGRIDDVRIYDSALTAGQVRVLAGNK